MWLFDVSDPAAPSLAGSYPPAAGRIAVSGADVFAGVSGAVSRLPLSRAGAAPVVTLAPPSSAAAGAHIPLGAAVSGFSDPLGAYTAELHVNGTLVEVTDSHLPDSVDLPPSGASATLELRVRD